MNKNRLYIILVFFLFCLTQSMGQNRDGLIRINNRMVDLEKVDIDDGLVLEKSEKYVSKNNVDSVYQDFSRTIFADHNSKSYIIADETEDYYEYSTGYNSYIEYFDGNGTKVFERTFKGLVVERCIIAYDQIFIKLGSEDHIAFYVLDNNGNEQKAFLDEEVKLSHSQDNSTIALVYKKPKSEYFIVDIYSEHGIFKLTYETSRPFIMNFSRNGKLITIGNEGYANVYDNAGTFQWKIGYNNNFELSYFDDGSRYIFIDYSDKKILEIRDFLTHELIFEIPNIKFHDTLLSIMHFRILDNSDDFYIEGYYEGSKVYDFYNKSGMYINQIVIRTDIRSAAKKPNFYKNDSRYEVRY